MNINCNSCLCLLEHDLHKVNEWEIINNLCGESPNGSLIQSDPADGYTFG